MKKMHRLVSLLLALLMVLALCACGSTKTEEQSKPAAAQQSSTQTGTKTDTATTAPETATTAETSSGEPVYGGTFGVGKAMSCPGLCSIYGWGSADQYNFPAVEPLGRWNFETQEYDPFLLESWEHDYDACTFTLNIRDGIMFHDGVPFDAEALKWNIDIFLENRGGTTLGNPTSVEITGDLQVTLHYEKPSYAWEGQISGLYMYSPKAYSEHDKDWAQVNAVGTGPFVMESYTPDQLIAYVRNDNYWQEGLPYLDRYNVYIILDWAANEAAFIEGYNNYYNVAEASTCKEMIGLGYQNVAIDIPQNYQQFYVMINNRIPDDPFYKKEVREAVLNYAIDWTGIAMARDDGRGLVTMQAQLSKKGSWGYIDDFWMDQDMYDQEKAKQMIADAGYPNGFDTKIYSTQTYSVMATQMQSELKKIGINAEVVPLQSNNSRNDPTLPGIHLGAWTSNADDANTIAQNFYKGYDEIFEYSDDYLALVERCQSALTKEERMETQQEILRILYEDMCCMRAYMSQMNYTVVAEGAHNVGAEYKTYRHEAIWWDPEFMKN